MRLSQLTRRMDKDDEICVMDSEASIDQNLLYEGRVRGIRREDPLNGAFVECICAADSVICVAVSQKK